MAESAAIDVKAKKRPLSPCEVSLHSSAKDELLSPYRTEKEFNSET